ncbi:ribosome recycling factor [candidate division WOR-3 bacterium JGI_Cruoil_03_51_56]|uniref:Ribosome-recycling factor n=1 Tax=candidate division WOR-3 bacterium JGI_Cruoil_03_51_56 TaxID=1973747 RepID=A0A235BTP6_UNCW3|nr:MAG: ribosome recycling factor [candidate division WOR-3 bacterium JGI_Cruoil_03_51_56]
MLEQIYKEFRAGMAKSCEMLEGEFARLRTSRANPAILDGIRVNYYGTPTPLKQVANISVPEPRQLVVQPWDRSVLPEIEKAILRSELGLNPKVEGNLIRLQIPPLTEERRRELVRLCGKLTEEARVAVRNLRREANEQIKHREKDKKISEDDAKTGNKKVQELTDDYIARLDELFKKKEAEILDK